MNRCGIKITDIDEERRGDYMIKLRKDRVQVVTIKNLETKVIETRRFDDWEECVEFLEEERNGEYEINLTSRERMVGEC